MRLPKEVVSGEHFVHKDLLFYLKARKADARARKVRLNEREEKRQEGLLRKAPGCKRSASSPPAGVPAKKKKKLVLNKAKEIKLSTPPKEVVIPPPTFVKEITIREPDHPVLPSVSSGSGCLAGLNHSGPSVPVPLPEEVQIGEARHVSSWGNPDGDNSDRNVCHVSSGNVRHVSSGGGVPTIIMEFIR